MSGGAKLAIGITVLVVLYIVWDWFSKKSEEDKKKEEEQKAAACTKLEDYEYLTLYQEKWNEQSTLFYRLDLPQQERWDLMRAMRDAYRQEAYIKGGILPNTNDTEAQIALYIVWKKAGDAMLAAGYCKQEVGGWKDFTNVY